MCCLVVHSINNFLKVWISKFLPAACKTHELLHQIQKENRNEAIDLRKISIILQVLEIIQNLNHAVRASITIQCQYSTLDYVIIIIKERRSLYCSTHQVHTQRIMTSPFSDVIKCIENAHNWTATKRWCNWPCFYFLSIARRPPLSSLFFP